MTIKLEGEYQNYFTYILTSFINVLNTETLRTFILNNITVLR